MSFRERRRTVPLVLMPSVEREHGLDELCGRLTCFCVFGRHGRLPLGTTVLDVLRRPTRKRFQPTAFCDRSDCFTGCLSRSSAVPILKKHDTCMMTRLAFIWQDQPVAEALVVSLPVINAERTRISLRNAYSPKKIMRSRQDSLMLRTNLSACAFRFGDRGGSFTDPSGASIS